MCGVFALFVLLWSTMQAQISVFEKGHLSKVRPATSTAPNQMGAVLVVLIGCVYLLNRFAFAFTRLLMG